MRCRKLVLLLIACSSQAFAGDPKFEFGKADELKDVKHVEWKASAEAGLVLTGGNSETTTATGGFRASRKAGDNKFAFEASGAYAKSGLLVLFDRNGNGLIDDSSEIITAETVTAETLASKLRYDRFLTASNSLFIAALASRDTPAGKDSVFGGQLGYSRRLFKSKVAETIGEFGYDFSREDLVTGAPVAIHSGRLFIGHKATLAESAELDMSGELLTNLNRETLPTGKDGGPFKDTRFNFRLGISAKIGLNLAVQTSIEAKYDNRPGPLAVKNLAMGFTPEAASLDTILKATFIYTFVGADAKKKK